MRRRWHAIVILLAFTAIAVFGFLGMMHGQEHGGCIAVAARAATCPSDAAAPFADIAFHIAAWKGFSTASAPSLLLLVIVALIILVVSAWRRCRFQIDVSRAESPRSVHGLRLIGFRPLAFVRWTAIHERRDPPNLSPVR